MTLITMAGARVNNNKLTRCGVDTINILTLTQLLALAIGPSAETSRKREDAAT